MGLSLRFIFSAFLIKFIECGHISTWDLELDYNNAGHAKEFSISFSLETTLSTSDYIKLIFPFPLHFSQTNNIPDYVTATYASTLLSHHCEVPSEQKASVMLGQETNSYLLQFLDSLSKPIGLVSSKFYIAKLILGGNNANIQSAGVKEPVQVNLFIII
jgi:hypothetical protein